MSEREPDDELHVEIEDIRGSEVPRGAWFVSRWPLFSPGTPHRRGHHLVLALSCLALAAALVLTNIPAAREGASTLVRTLIPAPATPAPAYASRFYLLPRPPSVTIMLDGRALDSPPLPGDPHPLVLAPGRHTFTWTSSWLPFERQACIVTVPQGSGGAAGAAGAAGACPIDPVIPPGSFSQPQPQPTGYVISILPTLAALPQDQVRALLGAIDAALATPLMTTAQPGEQYAVDNSASTPRVATAAEPLRATLRYTFPSTGFYPEPCFTNGALPCRFPRQDCGLICTAPPALAAQVGGPRDWIAGIGVRAAWTYTTESGRVIAQDVADPLGALVILRISWNDGIWQVAPILGHHATLPATDDAACDTPLAQLAGTASWSFIVTNPPPGASVATVSADSPADGCALVVLGHGDPTPIFLGRFGLLLTVNDTAVNPVDNLPVASTAEQALAQRLARLAAVPQSA